MSHTSPHAVAPYDVVVVGAGVVGSAIARALGAYDLRVALLDARTDVGDGTSKANTAILHTGFDAKPGTTESALVSRGYRLLRDYADQTGIPYAVTGALLVAWTTEELESLPGLVEKAEQNGYQRCQLVDAAEVYRQVPALGPGALGGLAVPGESIICPWTTTLAFATEAVQRGVTLLLEHPVEGVTRTPEGSVLHCAGSDVAARWVINATGLGGDHLDQLYGYDRFHLNPRRGELLVFDKMARSLVSRIVLPVPSKVGKGVLVSPTIYGNVMLGPTAEDMVDRLDTATTERGFAFLLDKGRRLIPTLLEEEVTASYAGLRAASDLSDYLLDVDSDQRYAVAGGIRSTGLTSSMAVAEHMIGELDKAGLELRPRDDLPEPPRMPNIGEIGTRPYQDAERIAADSAYGSIVCFCERATRGEIRDTFDSPVPPRDLSALRRRTRAMQGRCQGFYCGAEVAELLAQGLAASSTSPERGTAAVREDSQ